MNPTTVGSGVTLDPIEIVRQEYDACSRALVATSRNRLARHLTSVSGLSRKEALEVVDQYCNETNLPVPDYLSREFAVGYLKVLSGGWVIVLLILCWYGRNLHVQQRINPYGVWIMAAICGGLAVLFWLKSLEMEASNAKQDSQSLKDTSARPAPYSDASPYRDDF